ncbi:Cystathionine gamma-lyase [Blattella germanica]|nr:Cystathionine gamma-lyase [Blattella germanica]
MVTETALSRFADIKDALVSSHDDDSVNLLLPDLLKLQEVYIPSLGFFVVNMAEGNFSTKSVHLGYKPAASNNFSVGYLYTRQNNPSRAQLEKAIALLENSKYALCYSSGTSAIASIVQLLSNGDHIVSSSIIFGGTFRYFDKIISRANVSTTYVDATDPSNVEKALQDNTKLVFLESVSNPLNTVCDIAKIAQIVRKRKDIIFAVDNTYLTPYFLKPLDLGAHVSVYSLTKYMNGHDDVCMGAVCFSEEELYPKIKFLQNNAGLNPSPFDCYLVYRGLRTLPLRLLKHQKNSLEVAKFLESHPRVTKVMHPWLPSHPGHELAKRQFKGYTGMVAFYVKGDLGETSAFLKRLELISMCGSLGGVASIVEIPSVLSHASIPQQMRDKVGITDNLVRLSVGVEDVEDIIADLDQTLKKMSN